MKSRWNGYAALCVVLCFVSIAWGADHSGDKSADQARESTDQRPGGALRDSLNVTDSEWDALLPHIEKVEMLMGEARALRGDMKYSKPDQAMKITNDVRADGTVVSAPLPSSAASVERVYDAARELRALAQAQSPNIAEVRSKLSAYRAALSEAQQQVTRELADARAELIDLLTTQQELVCVVNGLLD